MTSPASQVQEAIAWHSHFQLALRSNRWPATHSHSIFDHPWGQSRLSTIMTFEQVGSAANERSERLSSSSVSPRKYYGRLHTWHRHGSRNRTSSELLCGGMSPYKNAFLLRTRAGTLQRLRSRSSALPSWMSVSTLAPCRAAGGFPRPEHRRSTARAAKRPGFHISNASIALGTTPS
jgi:hypothetical protein